MNCRSNQFGRATHGFGLLPTWLEKKVAEIAIGWFRRGERVWRAKFNLGMDGKVLTRIKNANLIRFDKAVPNWISFKHWRWNFSRRPFIKFAPPTRETSSLTLRESSLIYSRQSFLQSTWLHQESWERFNWIYEYSEWKRVSSRLAWVNVMRNYYYLY